MVSSTFFQIDELLSILAQYDAAGEEETISSTYKIYDALEYRNYKSSVDKIAQRI
jgi:hypothetical protein